MLSGPRPQYSLLAPAAAAAAGPLACFTWSVDLRSVCNPLSSYQTGVEQGTGRPLCACYRDRGGGQADCPPDDLSRAGALYFSLRVGTDTVPFTFTGA